MDNNILIDTEKMKVRHIKDNAEIRIYFNPESTNEKEIISKLNNYDSLHDALVILLKVCIHQNGSFYDANIKAINYAMDVIKKVEQT